MFTESQIDGHSRTGWIEVIVGSMFSGKTEELIRRLKRAKLANQKVEIFKSKVDKRYSEEQIVSHDNNKIHSTPVDKPINILKLSNHVEVIGIDEAQFFDKELVNVCNKLANLGKRVIVAGLDMDYSGEPFGPMPELLAIAEHITKTHAICMECGDLAQYTHRKIKVDEQVLLGEKDIYEPLCRNCYIKAQNL